MFFFNFLNTNLLYFTLGYFQLGTSRDCKTDEVLQIQERHAEYHSQKASDLGN